jgi:hypothetical protein
MHRGECVLTYNWGNSFKRYLKEGTQVRGRFGVAPTPGSTHVLDRKTKKLVKCDKDLCRYGDYYEDLGWVNKAPYMAFGGWACAVNNYTSPHKKKLAMDFCAFASSEKESIGSIIPNATGTGIETGQDPFRSSHLNLDLYVENGYERDTAKAFIDTIRSGLQSDNVVTDIRFPRAVNINQALDEAFFAYLLNASNHDFVSDPEKTVRIRQVSDSITRQWNGNITAYNNEPSTQMPLLESYQRLRNVYSRNENLNQLDGIRWYGFALMLIVFTLSLAFGYWAARYRLSPIVRASQPFFLVMICVGTIVLGSAILPMSVDNGSFSDSACSTACMSIPWLLALGWSIAFSALFSKLRRVNIVFKQARHFRRLKVTEKDVLLPFLVLFFSNLVLLLIWTLVDPPFWTRVQVNETESYGTCDAHGDSITWKVCVALIGALNGFALILANIEAYKARHISTEYGESKHIAMIMASLLQVVLVGLPLLFLVDDNPSAYYFLRCSIVFVICMSILLLIFVPKIHTWHEKTDARRPPITSQATGLRFQINENPAVVAQRAAKLDDYKKKVAHLEAIMIERGIEAESLFREAGLNNMDSTVDVNTGGVPTFASTLPNYDKVPRRTYISGSSVEKKGIAIDEKTAIGDVVKQEETSEAEGKDNGGAM